MKHQKTKSNRLSAAIFGAFHLIGLALRQQGCALLRRKPLKTASPRGALQFSQNGFSFKQGKARREYCRMIKCFDAEWAKIRL